LKGRPLIAEDEAVGGHLARRHTQDAGVLHCVQDDAEEIKLLRLRPQRELSNLTFGAEGELFNYGVNEDFTGYAIDFDARGLRVETVFHREKKIFTLTDVHHTFVIHAT
jgi:hypothetical protein